MEVMEREHLYNLEAETSVLGSILYNPELIHDCPNHTKHFSPGTHHNIFYTMKDLQGRGIPIDVVTLMNRVGPEKIEQLGGISYLSNLATTIVSTSNFKHHCNILLEYYQRREILNISKRTIENIHEENPIEIARNMVQAIEKIENHNTVEDGGDISHALAKVYQSLESATNEINGITTGFRDIDRMIGGYKGGQLVIVGARPSMGKTAYVINKAVNVATRDHSEDLVAFFSLETFKEDLLKRAISSMANIDGVLMRSAAKNFEGRHWKEVMHAMSQLTKHNNFKIFDRPGIVLSEICAEIRKLRRMNPGRKILVIIDYLQLVRTGGKSRDRREEVGEISRTLKLAAMEHDVPIICLSQLSRGVEQRQDKRPMMSDLRESGEIEQDADIIQFLYREDYYDKETENQNMIEVIIAKHRDGPTGNAVLAFIKEYGKFVNIDWNKSRTS